MKNNSKYIRALKIINEILDKKDRNGNPLVETNDDERQLIAVAIGRYNHNTIYDKGENSNFEYRYYARGTPYKGFSIGPITANANTLEDLRREINKETHNGYHK